MSFILPIHPLLPVLPPEGRQCHRQYRWHGNRRQYGDVPEQASAAHMLDLVLNITGLTHDDLFYYKNKPRIDEVAFISQIRARELACESVLVELA